MNTALEEHKINIWAEEKKEKSKESDLKDFQNDSFARVFDASCYPVFKHDPERNLLTLRMMEGFFTNKLKVQGNLLLNDVYIALGMRPIEDDKCRYVGWVYDEQRPIGDNFVDFGIFSDANRDFVNGLTSTAILSFNHDGDIKYYLFGF